MNKEDPSAAKKQFERCMNNPQFAVLVEVVVKAKPGNENATTVQDTVFLHKLPCPCCVRKQFVEGFPHLYKVQVEQEKEALAQMYREEQGIVDVKVEDAAGDGKLAQQENEMVEVA